MNRAKWLTCFQKVIPDWAFQEAFPLQATQNQEACHLHKTQASLYFFEVLQVCYCLEQTACCFDQVSVADAPKSIKDNMEGELEKEQQQLYTQ